MSLWENSTDHSIGLLEDGEFENTSSTTTEDGSSDGRLSPPLLHEGKSGEDSRLLLVQAWQYRLIGIGLAALFVVFGTGSAISAALSTGSSAGGAVNMGYCGLTVQEAQDNGCVFDLMMSGWVHPLCYDQDLSDEFLRVGNFTFYKERGAINILPEAEARLGNYDFLYTNGTYHYQHCAYIFAKNVRANKKPPLVLDNKSRSKEHVEHCWNLLGNPNITRLVLATGTKIQGSPYKLQCISGNVNLPLSAPFPFRWGG
ncbi:Major facilitator superfamily transporter protein [Rutstroemia sp. NJR-2017a WRK4]|nr:Major facilitator superfamily transporter protein [Rutstroemia sp. NJR-2017a WRK4]